ncbi:MAG: ribose-phosphate diphosphokinase [Salinispira sp.]
MDKESLIIVGTIADNPFVADIAQHLNQAMDYSDLISLKSFSNREFCPRFIVDESSWKSIGNKLKNKIVLIASTTHIMHDRDNLAMRNFLVARAAKDNGASRVILLEPDLFYSAQDRGPRKEHGLTDRKRDPKDYKKFDGQPFSAYLYADLLKKSGVDEIITVHNHSNSVERLFKERFSGHFHNLHPSDLFAQYIRRSNIVGLDNLIFCAPDNGAADFVREVHEHFTDKSIPLMILEKQRINEKKVLVDISPESEVGINDVKGKKIIVFDDMIRTGGTIVEACSKFKKAGSERIVFIVTHFYSSQETRIRLNTPVIDEIVTTSTIPQILNRDMQGRLRHKMVVLRIARWLSNYIHLMLNPGADALKEPRYIEDMSSKNPRWKAPPRYE